MRSAVFFVLCLPALVSGGTVRADDAPKLPRDAVAAAGFVQRAHAAADEVRLRAFAAERPPDPWLVADYLCGQGALEAAAAYAGLVPAPFGTALPALVAAESKTPTPTSAREAFAAAIVHAKAGRLDKVLSTIKGAGEVGGVTASRLCFLYGDALRALRRPVASAAAFCEAAELAEDLGWLSRASQAHKNQAHMLAVAGKLEEAADVRVKIVAIERRYELPLRIAMALIDLGSSAAAAGRLKLAEEALAEGEPLAARLGARLPQAVALIAQASMDTQRGRYDRARRRLQEALVVLKPTRDALRLASVHNRLALTMQTLNDYSAAIEHFGYARALFREARSPARESGVLINVGLLNAQLGRYARALEGLETGLEAATRSGQRVFAANAMLNLALTYTKLRDVGKARQYARRAQTAYETMSGPRGGASALKILGDIEMLDGQPLVALERYHEAASRYREARNAAGLAACLGSLAACYHVLKRHQEALDATDESIALNEKLGVELGVAETLLNRGVAQRALGDVEGAIASYDRAMKIGRRADLIVPVMQALRNRAIIELHRTDWKKTLEYVQRAAELIPRVMSGLAEGQGAQANEDFVRIFEMGVVAAHRLRDVASAFHLAERARGMTLREALGGRAKLEAVVLTPALRDAERTARIALTNARAAYQRARRRRRPRSTLRALGDVVSAAEARLEGAVQSSQRAARLGSNLVQPVPVSLEEFRETLEGDQAYVSFEGHPDFVQVFLITATSALSYQFPNTEAFRSAVAAVRANDVEVDPAGALATLRQQLHLADLGLAPTIGRLLIAPSGGLATLPWSLVYPDHEVCLVPSGTVYALLRCRPPIGGVQVLGLGGPVYEAGRGLAPLPAAADEVRAFSDVTLLGAEAAEAPLREALSRETAWRAIHFACHGVVDLEHPLRSRLALSASGEDDGDLTGTEILGLRIRADLVTLSACETGLGRVYSGEGVVGLTRSFFIAGAPCVLCSLWKVDDAATKALMLKFYELWHPKSGRGIGAAAALKKAQTFVRGQSEWEHPYYWAAWVLWGLPD